MQKHLLLEDKIKKKIRKKKSYSCLLIDIHFCGSQSLS
jgi:hypothetical protein